MDINPLSIILVKSDSKGDRMLFRYPHATNQERVSNQGVKRKNPYLLMNNEDHLQSMKCPTSIIKDGNLTGLPDEVLSTLFAVKSELCQMKFELKVNNIRFVGHPTLLSPRKMKEANSSMLFNVVFALQAQANNSVVKCYYDLSKRLGIALKHEERRCDYLSNEIKLMVSTHDEIATRTEEEVDTLSDKSAYELILKTSSLAQDLKSAYDSLCTSGVVNIMVNNWIKVNFCLPQRVHQTHKPGFIMNPEIIDRCLRCLRPYHGILLLIEPRKLLDSLPDDASPALRRLINMCSPLMSLQTLAADTDISLSQIFQLTGHLLYWAKATVIYPICENNVYVVAPDAIIEDKLIVKFKKLFPDLSLYEVLSEFSLSMSISHKSNPINEPKEKKQLVNLIIWLLKKHLLLQLHTYIQYLPLPLDTSESETKSQDGSSPITCIENETNWTLDNALNIRLNTVRSIDEIYEYRTDKFPIPSEDIMMLDKFCKLGYFDGGHHIEEIMYLENLRRSQVLQLLDKFRHILITSEHEDPAIALFYSQP